MASKAPKPQIIPSIFKNKYFLTLVAFLSWMFFFDENSFMKQVQLQMEIKKVDRQKLIYEEGIQKAKKDLKDLTTDHRTQEKYAREKFLMKKENEDLYIIE